MINYFSLAIIFLLANFPITAQEKKNFSDNLFYEKIGKNTFVLKLQTQQNFDTIFVYEINNTDGFGQRKISSHPKNSSGKIFLLDTVKVEGQRGYFITLKRKNFPESLRSNIITIINESPDEEIEMEIGEPDSVINERKTD